MRILFLAHRIPYPPNKGDKIRAFHEIHHLARRHEVHLACLVDREEDFTHVRHLETICKSVTAVRLGKVSAYLGAAASLIRGEPLSPGYFSSDTLRHSVDRLLKQLAFDRVVAYSSSMASYLASHQSCPKILDMVDVDSDKWAQYASRASFPRSRIYALEARRLRRYERTLVGLFDRVVLVTAQEAALLRRENPQADCSVVTNGVDLEYFSPPVQRDPAPRLVFTGAMDYYANVDAMVHFCEDIFPLIRSRRPDAQMVIVGSNPSRLVRRLARRPGVAVTGTVPDVRPYLTSARVFVAPFRLARGIQNKILEALASGLPVVASTAAAAALPVAKGLQAADGPESFAHTVLELLENPGLWEEASRDARDLAERHFRWERSLELFEQAVCNPSAAERSLKLSFA